jgi:hypothetical protein
MMATRAETRPAEVVRPPLIQWRAVFAGGVVGLGLFVLLTLLWVALAYGSAASFFASSLSWWIGGSAIVSVLIGAYLTGWLGGVRGWGPGVINAVTMWGLVVAASTVVGLPALLASLHIIPAVRGGAGLWPMFWSVLIALGTAIIGGALGGSVPQRATLFLPEGERVPSRGHAVGGYPAAQ